MNYISSKVKLVLIVLLTFSNFYAIASSINPSITGTKSNVTAQHIGPAIGGAMFAIAIDPTDKQNIFSSGDMGVVYHTINGGNSWNIVPGMYNIRSIVFDPNNSNILWAVGETGVYKSIDKGEHWQYRFNTFHSDNFSIGAIAIDPTDSNIVYVAEGHSSYYRLEYVRGRVFKTTDGGANWIQLARPGGDSLSDSLYNRNYSKILIDPNSSYTPGVGHSDVYLMGRDGLFKTTDAGDSWQNITFFDEGQGSDAILIDDNNQSKLIVSVIPINTHIKKGVYKSTDNGQTWNGINNGLNNIIDALYTRNHSILQTTQFVLMLGYSASNKNTIYVGSWQGIAKTTNQGQSWTQTTPAETPYTRHVSGEYVQVPLNDNSRYHNGNQTETFLGGIDNFINMTVSNSDSNFVIFGDNQDLHFSTDGGTVWKSRTFDYNDTFVNPLTDILPDLPSGAPANRYTHKIKSRGVQGLVNTDIAIDPFDSNIYYATYMDVGLQISRDAGKTWEHPTNGLPPKGHTWSVTVNPNNNGTVWVSIGYNGAIYKSADHGVSWNDVSINVPSTGRVTDMIFDAQNSILYAATEFRGIFKSSDEGQTWQNIFSVGTFDIKIDLLNKNILYAGTQIGLYKSINRGNTWTQLASAQMGKVYNISVGKNNTIYTISNNAGQSESWRNRKLWVSTDAGVNFQEITPSFMHKIGGVAVDSNNPNLLYISAHSTRQTYQNDQVIMAQSNDGGVTWKKLIDNFAFALGTDIYINPKDSNNIFFNTNFSLIEVNKGNTTPTLTANAGADKTLNVTPSNRAIHFVGTGTGDAPLSYKWYDNGTYLGSNADRWNVMTQNGQHNITLVVTDVHGNEANDTMVVTVHNITANAGADQTLNVTPSNRAVHLVGTGTGVAPLSYKWYLNGSYLGPNADRWNVITQNGQYTITLVVTDANGAKATDTMVVTVKNGVDNNATTVTANAGADQTLNVTPSNRAIHFVGTGTGDAPLSYKWYDNGTYLGPNADRWNVMTQDGQHNITLVVTDVHGNEANDTMVVTVNN